MSVGLEATLLAVDERSNTVSALPVHFRRRVTMMDTATLLGTDFRLLVFHEDAGAIVAITAHERNFVVAGPDGEPLPGSYFMVAAITDRFRMGDRQMAVRSSSPCSTPPSTMFALADAASGCR